MKVKTLHRCVILKNRRFKGRLRFFKTKFTYIIFTWYYIWSWNVNTFLYYRR